MVLIVVVGWDRRGNAGRTGHRIPNYPRAVIVDLAAVTDSGALPDSLWEAHGRLDRSQGYRGRGLGGLGAVGCNAVKKSITTTRGDYWIYGVVAACTPDKMVVEERAGPDNAVSGIHVTGDGEMVAIGNSSSIKEHAPSIPVADTIVG